MWKMIVLTIKGRIKANKSFSDILVGLAELTGVFLLLLSIPSNASGAFTYSYSLQAPKWGGQGLESDGTNLFYLGDDKTIYTLDSNDGRIINSFPAPISHAGLGLAYNGHSFFIIDSSYEGGPGSVYEINLTNGSERKLFDLAEAAYSAAFFNGSLYVGGESSLRELDPSNGSLLNSYQIDLPFGGSLNGLTAYGTSLIASIGYNGNEYVELDPSSGTILSAFTLSFSLTDNQGVRGLASDGTRLFATAFDYHGYNGVIDVFSASPVPIPGAIWLLGSGLIGLVSLRRRLQSHN